MRIYAAPIYTPTGETGDYEVATELVVLDAGDNELWRGRPGHEPAYRIPVTLVATKRGAQIDPESADRVIS